MGVTVTREVEVEIFCADCGGELIVRSVDNNDRDYSNFINVYVEPCSKCNSIDVSDVV